MIDNSLRHRSVSQLQKDFGNKWNFDISNYDLSYLSLYKFNRPIQKMYKNGSNKNLLNDKKFLKSLYKKKSNHHWMYKYGFISDDGDHSKFIDIDYTINAHGFRSDDFSNRNEGILTLGCSDTFGNCQFEKYTWPRILSTKLDLSCYNLGIGGASLDLIYILFKKYVSKVNIRNVFLLTPSPLRMTILKPDIFSVLPGSIDKDDSIYQYFMTYSSYNANGFINYNKTIDAIKWECNKRDLNLFIIDNPSYYDGNYYIYDYRKYNDLAADGLHNGRIFQKKVAYKFLEMFYEKDNS